MKIYLANGLFSEADRDFNIKVLGKILESKLNQVEGLEVYVPQLNMSINDKSQIPTFGEIFDGDNAELDTSDFLLAVIDGVEIDSGVAAEIGRASALDIPVIALCTDIRFANYVKGTKQAIKDGENPVLYRNGYVLGAVDVILTSSDSVKDFFDGFVESYHEEKAIETICTFFGLDLVSEEESEKILKHLGGIL